MATKKRAQVEEVEDDELEELEDAEETSGSGDEEVIWGVRNGLIPLLKEKTGKDYTPREVRTLLRKMARDGSNRINREIIAGNKSRYQWDGPDDPEVKAILKAVKGGEIEQGKKEALDKLKADKAAKQANADKPAAKASKKGKAAPPPDDDDDDLEDLEDDD